MWVSTIERVGVPGLGSSIDGLGLDRARSLTTYLVEIATDDQHEPGSVAARARDAVGPARFLRSVYVPEDDRWFLLYEGSSATEVAAAAELADLDVVSIAASRGFPKASEEDS